MDKVIQVPLGPDLTFGTADDVTMQFGADRYSTLEQFQGLNDTLNTVAFGFSTGKGAAAATGATAPGTGAPAAHPAPFGTASIKAAWRCSMESPRIRTVTCACLSMPAPSAPATTW